MVLAVGAAAAETPSSAPSTRPALTELVGKYAIEDAHLLQPFWASSQAPEVKAESVLFIQEKEGEPATGTLLLTPGKVRRVIQSREGTPYEEGRDFTVDALGRRLVLTKDSRIPFLKRAELYKKKGEKQGIKQKADDPETWLLYQEYFFPSKQVDVDYTAAETWNGYRPTFAGEACKGLLDKLKKHQPVCIAVLGDSITGANASGKGYKPHMPPYNVLLAAELEKVYGSKVDLVRLGVAGATTEGGLKKIHELTEVKPDLAIIAFGMNDVAGHNPTGYGRNTKGMLDAIRAESPKTAVILIASSCANPQWSWSPWDQFPKYRDALASLCGPRVVLADMTTLWRQIIERKRYHDLAGNGINHPNDYGHRLMAQVLLGMLVNQ